MQNLNLPRPLLAIALTGLIIGPVVVQEQRGVLRGRSIYAQDTADRALPGVDVVVTRGPELVAKSNTNRQGLYEISNLPAGDYVVRFALQGFIAVECPVRIQNGVTASSSALAIAGFDTGEPAPDDERRRLCFGGETPIVMSLKGAPGDSRTFLLLVDAVHAPATAGQFLRDVAAKSYDDGTVQRVSSPLPGAGPPRDPARSRSVIDVLPGKSTPSPAIAFESTRVTGLLHRAGTITMPRRSDPDTAPAGFTILLEDDASFDVGGSRFPDRQGSAAFGRILLGVRGLQDMGSAPVRIKAMTVVGGR